MKRKEGSLAIRTQAHLSLRWNACELYKVSLVNFIYFLGKQSYLHQAPVCIQRKALELLWYISSLEIDNIKILVDFATNKMAEVGVIQYLIQIIHHR